jgi:uncharacterized membrane protein
VTERRRVGLTLAALATAGLLIAAYLAAVKLTGGIPVCGPLRGCETVNTSPYSELLGIPVALFGVLFSALVLLAALAWWRTGDRRALYGAYGLGLAGMVAVAYLTYLELFVIGAVCIWCVAYAVTVVAGWVGAALTLRATG